MSFRPNTRRIFTSWAEAARCARMWGYQAGVKYRIRSAGDDLWRVERTDKPAVRPMRAYTIGNVIIVI
jgi:hypothetical protein